MTSVFFRASEDALDSITKLFNFVHPLNASLVYTRKKVDELCSKNSAVTQEEIQTVIDPERDVPSANYVAAFIKTSRETHEELLAWLLLNNLFSIHEGWCKRLWEDVFAECETDANTLAKDDWNFVKLLQRNNLICKISPNHNSAHISVVLKDAYYDVYRKGLGYKPDLLDNYMLCYRYFKEARNCFMHKNRTADDKICSAYSSYLTVATCSQLDLKETPEVIPPQKGKTVGLSLRGVIGFSEILRRIIAISDLYLLTDKAAEKEYLARKPKNWTCKTLSSNENTARSCIEHYSRKAGFLTPNWTTELQSMLVSEGIIAL